MYLTSLGQLDSSCLGKLNDTNLLQDTINYESLLSDHIHIFETRAGERSFVILDPNQAILTHKPLLAFPSSFQIWR